MLTVDGGEERVEAADRLRFAKDEHAARNEGVMERTKDSLLERRSEVDEKVAATDDVDARERRIASDVVAGEDAAIPQRLADLVPALHRGEEPFQPLRRHLPTDRRRVNAAARDLECGIAQIARKDLHGGVGLQRVGRIQRADCHRVGFLAGCAPRDPEAERVPGQAAAQQAGKSARRDGVEDPRVAKEPRDVDQDVPVQCPNLLRFALQEGEIGNGGIEAMTALTPADPTDERSTLVLPEVHSGGALEERGHLIECGGFLARRTGTAPARARRLGRFLDGLPCQRPRDALRRQDHISATRVDGGQGHAAIFRGLRFLGESPTPGRADRADAARAIRSGARENHGRRQGTSIGRERIQELVDHRRRTGSRRAGGKPQSATGNRQHGTGRDDINVARIHSLPVRGLAHGHRGCTPQ